MLSSVTLDDHTGTPVAIHLDTSSSKTFSSQALGLVGGVVSAPRQVKSTLPNAHGAINNTKYSDGSTITLACEVQGTSIEDAFAQFRAVSAVCQQTLDYGPALLKWTEGATGLQLQRLVRLDGAIDPPVSDGVAKLSFQLQFFAEDPRAYNQTATTTATGTVSSLLANSTFTADTVGSAPAHWTATNASSAKVEANAWGSLANTYLVAQSSLAASATVSTICDKFAVSPNTDYSCGIGANLNLGNSPNVTATLKLNWYNASGTLISSSTIDSAVNQIWGTGIAVMAGHATSPASVATAAVEFDMSANASQLPAANVWFSLWAVTVTPTISLTVPNAGDRDTLPSITTTFPAGKLTFSSANVTLPLTNSFWALQAGTDTVTVDLGKRLISSTVTTSVLSYLVAANALWGGFSPGNTTLTVVGALVGSTVTVTSRDGY